MQIVVGASENGRLTWTSVVPVDRSEAVSERVIANARLVTCFLKSGFTCSVHVSIRLVCKLCVEAWVATSSAMALNFS